MFYKIAIIQNEKELFKYDCADWSKNFDQCPLFAFYKVACYNEHNIADVFDKLLSFDAVFFSTNALNSKEIYDACVNNATLINEFIQEGKGLFVGYSSKQKNRDFLPEKYRAHQVQRKLEKEGDEKEGVLDFKSLHPIVSAHLPFALDSYISSANDHNTIAGLYFDYLVCEDSAKDSFDEIVKDDNGNRSLLLCSSLSSGNRVVLSTLPVDWQNHFSLLANIIKFCAEGQAKIDIVSCKSGISDDFSREFLAYQLNANKIPFKEKSLESIDELSLLSLSVQVVIFDSTWKEKVIDRFCKQNESDITLLNLRLLHYFEYSKGDKVLYKLCVHSAFQEIDLLENCIILAIESRTPDEKQKYFYDSSLLTTLDTVRFLQSNNRRTPTLYPYIIEFAKKRLCPDGSYDAMFVPSCTLLVLWTICDEGCHSDAQYRSLKAYVSAGLTDEKHHLTPSEKAQILHLLGQFDDVWDSDETKTHYFNCVIDSMLHTENNSLFSYGIANCLQALGEHIDIMPLSKNHITQIVAFFKRTIPIYSTFNDVAKVPITANYIFAMSRFIKNYGEKCGDALTYLHKFLFAAVGFLYNSLEVEESCSLWHNDIYTSCLAITALKEFHSMSVYPVDEIISLLKIDDNLDDAVNNSHNIVSGDLLALSKKQTDSIVYIRNQLSATQNSYAAEV
jgi:hypothetical protein